VRYVIKNTASIALINDNKSFKNIQKILDATTSIFGQSGFFNASMSSIAKAAGVSKGLLHYHFDSKEQLLFAAQRATYKKINTEFEKRFARGDKGLKTALEALDAIWDAIYEMRESTPFMLETIGLSSDIEIIQKSLNLFCEEATLLLENGIKKNFEKEIKNLTVPPKRLAYMVRIALHGIIVELSMAKSEKDLKKVRQGYLDMKKFFKMSCLKK
jgi:AcrR family transcriptional regulator